MRTASAWPVVPAQTSSYVGFSRRPPVYPATTDATPSSFLKGGSMHQKQPPANVAVLGPSSLSVIAHHPSFEYEKNFVEVFPDFQRFFPGLYHRDFLRRKRAGGASSGDRGGIFADKNQGEKVKKGSQGKRRSGVEAVGSDQFCHLRGREPDGRRRTFF